MKHTNKFFVLTLVLLLVAALSACDDNDDEAVVNYPDEGALGVTTTNSRAQLIGFTDDNDNYYSFDEPYTDSNGNLVANTTYRVYVLYKNTSYPGTVQFYGGETLDMQDPVMDGSVDEIITDPIQSMNEPWVSNNGRFLNIEFTIFPTMEFEDGKDQQVVKWLYLGQNKDGETEIRMYHDQAGSAYYLENATTFSCMPIAGNFHSNEVVRIYYHTLEDGEGYESSWVITIPVLNPDIEDAYNDTHN